MHPRTFFQHCPRCGLPAPEVLPKAPFYCERCSFLYYFNPAIAAAALILREDGAALFIRRSKDPGRGKLAMPGGFIDPGESAEEGLRREVREEVNLELDRLEYFGSFPNEYAYRGVTYQVLDLYFFAKTNLDHQAKALDDVDAFEWVLPASVDLNQIAFSSMRTALERMRKKG